MKLGQFFFARQARRAKSSRSKRGKTHPRRHKILLEPLESRLLLSADLQIPVPALNLNTPSIDTDDTLPALTQGVESPDHLAGLEAIESQPLLSGLVAHWIGGSGNWSDPTKWDIGVVPNNSGDTMYTVVIDLTDADPVITVDQNVTISGLTNAESMDVQAGTFNVSGAVNNTGTIEVVGTSATTTFSNNVINSGTISAAAGILRFASATVSNVGRTITADGGIVEVANSTMNGGTLVATDKANSFVRFSGDVTLNGVPWEDPGTGEFQVHGTTRLLGDYETQLPAGYRLVVQSDWWAPA
ncbi:MAG: LEPR-XLL domain-containing protein [Candidatus Tectomicrobia bacterium]|uniref:LEPR-XLL domain-containing protein n=1 Tax=Tectimicrobiota bacterium TaxID=2528274 RepID=A0A932CLA6_UNCTE|nr:LEPR-XLL domain-containing protein [Candidatus Tectomicrobia bacterium]